MPTMLWLPALEEELGVVLSALQVVLILLLAVAIALALVMVTGIQEAVLAFLF
jgi:hypothetical protein